MDRLVARPSWLQRNLKVPLPGKLGKEGDCSSSYSHLQLKAPRLAVGYFFWGRERGDLTDAELANLLFLPLSFCFPENYCKVKLDGSLDVVKRVRLYVVVWCLSCWTVSTCTEVGTCENQRCSLDQNFVWCCK
jgi:hypothetical protein